MVPTDIELAVFEGHGQMRTLQLPEIEKVVEEIEVEKEADAERRRNRLAATTTAQATMTGSGSA